MPHRARPMAGLLVFMGVNLLLLNTISPVYDFVCFHPCWDRRTKAQGTGMIPPTYLVFAYFVSLSYPGFDGESLTTK